jgi:hypothetical protein
MVTVVTNRRVRRVGGAAFGRFWTQDRKGGSYVGGLHAGEEIRPLSGGTSEGGITVRRVLGVLAVISVLLGACVAWRRKPIRIGLSRHAHGRGFTWGQHEAGTGAVMAVEEINAAGGLLRAEWWNTSSTM